MIKTNYWTLPGALLLPLVPQMLWGNIQPTMFAFPLNLALLLALAGGTYVLYREKKHTKTLRWWGSAQVSLLLFFFLFIGSLLIALAPQLDFQHSWFFNGALLLLLAHLQLTLHYYGGPNKIRFYLLHSGIYLFIAALTFGAPDTERTRAVASEGQTIAYAYDKNGRPHPIGFQIRLDKFDVSYYDNGIPKSFKATVTDRQTQKDILVNHPWNRSWDEDIYLVSHGTDPATHRPYCVLEFIRQPWKYAVQLGLILTVVGAFMLLWGKKFNR